LASKASQILKLRDFQKRKKITKENLPKKKPLFLSIPKLYIGITSNGTMKKKEKRKRHQVA
jgi:hypothetical protein